MVAVGIIRSFEIFNEYSLCPIHLKHRREHGLRRLDGHWTLVFQIPKAISRNSGRYFTNASLDVWLCGSPFIFVKTDKCMNHRVVWSHHPKTFHFKSGMCICSGEMMNEFDFFLFLFFILLCGGNWVITGLYFKGSSIISTHGQCQTKTANRYIKTYQYIEWI